MRCARVGEGEPTLTALVDRVTANGVPVRIERDGAMAAVLISAETWERYLQMSKDRAFEVIDRIWQANADVDPAVIEAEVAQAVEDVRRERRNRQERSSA